MAAEMCLLQLPGLLKDPNAEFVPSNFFSEQLTAFELWLHHGSKDKAPPEQLPIVLQARRLLLFFFCKLVYCFLCGSVHMAPSTRAVAAGPLSDTVTHCNPLLTTAKSPSVAARRCFCPRFTAPALVAAAGQLSTLRPISLTPSICPPIAPQVLLSQVHRLRALVLLGRFLDMGPWAVDLALSVGIFPYVLKLLQTTSSDLRNTLVFIWCKILALDPSCQVGGIAGLPLIFFSVSRLIYCSSYQAGLPVFDVNDDRCFVQVLVRHFFCSVSIPVLSLLQPSKKLQCFPSSTLPAGRPDCNIIYTPIPTIRLRLFPRRLT